MWGSSLADIARKAQELQDHATSAASSLAAQTTPAASASSFFNLDAMQQDRTSTSGAKPPPKAAAPQPSSIPANVPETVMDRSESDRGPTTTENNTNAVSKETETKEEVKPVETSDSSSPEEESPKEGWGAEEDDLDELESGSEVPAPSEAEMKTDDANNQSPIIEREDAEKAPMEKEETAVPATITGPPNLEAVTSTPEPPESKGETTVAADSPPDDAAETTRQKLVVLITSTPMNRQTKTRQDMVFTVLDSLEVAYDKLDGAEQQELRRTLLEVSGLPAIEYPLFFLINLPDGGPTYWGNWDDFSQAHENKMLAQAFGSSAEIETEAPVEATPTLQTIARDAPSPSPSQSAELREKDGTKSSTDEDTAQVRFSQQLLRLEEHHQAETASLRAAHANKLAEIQSNAEKLQAELQKRMEAQILSKEEQLQEVCRRNEGYRLKMDMLKREVAGTQELLQEKDSVAGKTDKKHLNELRTMEKKAMDAESKATQAANECQKVKNNLDSARQELANSVKEHNELKERVKLVATELKERRVECRDLHTKIDEMMEEKDELQGKIDSLSESLNHQGVSQTEKDGELEAVKAKLVDSNLELEKAHKEWKEREDKHERALTEYKRKAQNSLSMANSRIAGAVQAREEAELDARAARATADSAFERATKAEFSSREAVAEAKAKTTAIETERDDAIKRLDEATELLNSTMRQLSSSEGKLKQALETRDSKATELEELRNELRSVHVKVAECEQRLVDAERSNKRLQNENESLYDQLQKAKAENSSAKSSADPAESAYTESFPVSQQDDATVLALQEELVEANNAIDGLKEALKNALTVKEDHNQEPTSMNGGNEHGGYSNGGQSDAGIPLFYAMEKQAELVTARAEINRLASTLADLQSEKAEATESMNGMRKRMEDAEARLKRFEKLGSRPEKNTEDQSNGVAHENVDSGAVNVEYLKHITLKYISAKTTPERKALVPVIGAILELTPDEMSTAIAAVDQASATTSFFGF